MDGIFSREYLITQNNLAMKNCQDFLKTYPTDESSEEQKQIKGVCDILVRDSQTQLLFLEEACNELDPVTRGKMYGICALPVPARHCVNTVINAHNAANPEKPITKDSPEEGSIIAACGLTKGLV
jgi:ABC-type antimicrobial peptide transport system ATPase subunit